MIRRVVTVLCAVAVCAGLVLMFSDASPRAGAASPPAMAVDPAIQLSDGQFVKLTFSGFAPNIGLALRQCIPNPANVATDCTAPDHQVIGITDGNGGGSAYLQVHAGKLTATNGTGSIQCDVSHPCVIAAMHVVTDLTTAVLAPITFDRSKDDCPPAPASAILGGGSASAYRAVYRWESAVCVPPLSLPVGYTVTNSSDGAASFLNGIADFGVTGPFTTAPLPGPNSTTPGVKYSLAPITASAVVLAYRIYDTGGPQVTNLTLTPDLIAKIFLGQIPNWTTNAALTALNPGVTFPSRIVPFARAEHSAQSLVFASWLHAAAPTVFTANPSAIYPIPAAGVQGVTGSDLLGLKVADPLTDWLDQGNIGFMDSSTAAFYGLPAVRIARADGSVVSATPDAITQAIGDATLNSDGTLQLDYADANPKAYPMPMPTYLMAPTNTISPERGAFLAGFLRYAVQTGQSTLLQGYAPLPANLVKESLAVAAQIPVPPPPAPSPTPTPPTATPAPTPVPTPRSTPPPQIDVPPVYSNAYEPQPVALAEPIETPAPTPHSPLTGGGSPTPGLPMASVQPPIALDLARMDDTWTAGRFALPAVVAAGMVGLTGGVALEVALRRRQRVITPENEP